MENSLTENDEDERLNPLTAHINVRPRPLDGASWTSELTAPRLLLSNPSCVL